MYLYTQIWKTFYVISSSSGYHWWILMLFMTVSLVNIFEDQKETKNVNVKMPSCLMSELS